MSVPQAQAAVPLEAAPVPPESLAARWQRRALTLPVVALLWLVSTAALPVLLPLALVVDAVRPRRMVVTRTLVFFVAFLWLEWLGLLVAALLWLVTLRGMGLFENAFLAGNAHLQVAWNRAVFGVGRRVFGLTLVVENPELLRSARPLIVLPRHVSTVDTVLPVVLLSAVGRLNFRFVLKRELLADPCLDVVGNRLPNHFVRRGLQDNADEVASVKALADGLEAGDTAVIFPEGGRFSAARRMRLIEKLRQSPRGLATELAESLHHTLPPLTEGTLAMLEGARGADVLVLGHAGLEGASGFPDFIRGALVGATLRVRLWRIPAEQLAVTREARQRLLGDVWKDVDAFVGTHTG